jgi:hypothetical protein
MRSMINKIKQIVILSEICLVCGSSGPRGAGCPKCGNPIP